MSQLNIDYENLHRFADRQGINRNKLLTVVKMCVSVDGASLQAAPAQVERLQWCEQCGEGVVNFCRGKGEKCGYGFPKPGQPEPAQPVNQVNESLAQAQAQLAQVVATETWFDGDRLITRYLTADDIYKPVSPQNNDPSR